MVNTHGGPSEALPGAGRALALLFIINLFNYIDRQVLSAVLPRLQLDANLFDPADPWLQSKLGFLTSVFLVSYTLLSPVFGWFGNRGRRWWVVGIGVLVWSLASGGSGLATGYVMLLLTRCAVGIGEAAYGPVAPSMLSDLYPVSQRGKVMALFYLAIPVGSALGFVIGGQIGEHFGWRTAFLVTFIGWFLGWQCFFMPEPPQPNRVDETPPSYLRVLAELKTIRSFVIGCLGMTCTTFVLGGVAAWAPTYIFQREARFAVTDKTFETLAEERTSDDRPVVPDEVVAKLRPLTGMPQVSFAEFKQKLRDTLPEDRQRAGDDFKQYGDRIFTAATTPDSISLGTVNLIFGVIVVVSGLGATLLGGWFGEYLLGRGIRGAYFHAAGWSTMLAFPFLVGALLVPFPVAWGLLFAAVFFLFFNTGPANTLLANVMRSDIRATGYAINILVIHMLGDVISPPIIGFVADVASLQTAFLGTSVFILIGGTLWVFGASSLDADTAKAGS
ncbi:spinster family MFS transporter [Limnoglobus roseus]|nr:MFS transporter [Limnoglobus roseus]